MDLQLRIELFILAIGLIFLIVRMVNKNLFSLKKSFPWLLLSLVCLLMVIFPNFINYFSQLLSFKSPMNFLFFGSISFLFLMQILNTYLGTRRDSNVKMLVQELSLLKAKVEELEKDANK